MSRILLDTNVVSELTKEAPDRRVLAFLARHDDLWLSAVVLHELDFGVGLLPPGRRHDGISAVLSAFVTEYEDRILPVGRAEVRHAAVLRARAHRAGQVLDLGDALIAGTARANGLAVATRNVRDFDGLGLDVIDPWRLP